jgi:Acyl CoA:acetate/3-ketoacid CoA transferase
MKLTPSGIVVTEIAPGIELERDVLAQADFPLLPANDLKIMPEALFHPAPIGLDLPQARP